MPGQLRGAHPSSLQAQSLCSREEAAAAAARETRSCCRLPGALLHQLSAFLSLF